MERARKRTRYLILGKLKNRFLSIVSHCLYYNIDRYNHELFLALFAVGCYIGLWHILHIALLFLKTYK